MKNKSSSQSALICLFVVLAFVVYSSPAWAASTDWIDTSGDWFTDANWDNHVPTTSTDALVNNAGTAQINYISTPPATAQSLVLGLNATDSGTASVDGTNGGSLTIPPGCGSYTQNIYPGVIAVGYQGFGTLNITGGATVSCSQAYIAGRSGEVVASNGSVKVDGANSTWTITNNCTPSADSRLFIGGSYVYGVGDDPGGTAILTVTNGGTVTVTNPGGTTAVKVGPSGTLTGNGTITTNGTSSLAKLTAVQGTLAPKGTLNITNDLAFSSTGTMLCNVTQGHADMVSVGDVADLNGRVSVVMTGTFNNSITQYTLLKTVNGLDSTTFASVSITYPTGEGFVPSISYDSTHVYLNLVFSGP